jgi:hypothetical protein
MSGIWSGLLLAAKLNVLVNLPPAEVLGQVGRLGLSDSAAIHGELSYTAIDVAHQPHPLRFAVRLGRPLIDNVTVEAKVDRRCGLTQHDARPAAQ